MNDLLQDFYNGKLTIDFSHTSLENFKELSSILNKKWIDGTKLEDHYRLFKQDNNVFLNYVQQDDPESDCVIAWSHNPEERNTINIRDFIDACNIQISVKQQDIQAILQNSGMHEAL